MSVSERPGVYTSVDVSSVLSASGRGRVVGIAARAEKGEKGKAVPIASYAEAAERFGGDSSLAALTMAAMKNGAPSVCAVPAATAEEPSTEDYTAAFAALMENTDIGVMVCGSHDADVHSAMKAAIEGASENAKYRIGIVDAAGTAAELAALAQSLNCERMVMAGPCAADSGGDALPGLAAAAIAGQTAAVSDPALPLNGAQLYGLEGLEFSCSDADVDTMVRGGVTPIENVNGEFFAVRGVTTRTKTNGAADSTWRELTTVLIVNDVIPTVRAALRTRFARSKNTAQTRGAIRTQVMIELENKLAHEIIDSYGNIRAEASAEDPTLCEVSFDFTAAHGLNRIELTAHITV